MLHSSLRLKLSSFQSVPLIEALIPTFPAANAVTNPFESTVAMFVSLEVQVIVHGVPSFALSAPVGEIVVESWQVF
jgi:hypothetical protein